MNKLICFGHRGASGHEPENTLASFEKAISMGVDFVELDVYCVEGELVVIHDERLERTTNGSGYVMEKSLDYLRSLDAGNGERIPLLTEVIELVDRRAGINIELKGSGTAKPVVDLIKHCVDKQGWNLKQFIVSSFNHHQLKNVNRLLPQVQIGVLLVCLPLHFAQITRELNAYSIHLSLAFINQEFVNDAQGRGLKVFVYTVNHKEDVARMKALGINGVFTNYPELVVE